MEKWKEEEKRKWGGKKGMKEKIEGGKERRTDLCVREERKKGGERTSTSRRLR